MGHNNHSAKFYFILFKQYNFLLETVKCYKFSYKKMIYKCYNLPYITLEIP